MAPQVLFWLGRIKHIQKQDDEGRSYFETLVKQYPLSFYSTIAFDLAKIPSPTSWASSFSSPNYLRESLKIKSPRTPEFNIDPILAPLALRAQILIKAQLGPWAQGAVADLHAAVRRHAELKAKPELYVTISRLYYAVGDFNQAISLTTQIAQAIPGFWAIYPEQLLVYFPQPFRDLYQHASTEYDVDLNWLLAISRQESGFRADVTSGANAHGLMQLIVPTAQRFATPGYQDNKDWPSRLLNPETNVKIAANYLNYLGRYYQKQESLVFGAYNAGEFVVDSWVKQRPHPDLLTWIELIPFGETKGYVRNVWRNFSVYRYIGFENEPLARNPEQSLLPF